MACVYLLEEGAGVLPNHAAAGVATVKIGKGDDLQQRLRQLKTGNPRPIEVLEELLVPDGPSAFYVETLLHHEFGMERIPGTEWFLLPPGRLAEARNRARQFSQTVWEVHQRESAFFDQTATTGERKATAEETRRFNEVKHDLLQPNFLLGKRIERAKQLARGLAIRNHLTGRDGIFTLTTVAARLRWEVHRFAADHEDIKNAHLRIGNRQFRWSFRGTPPAEGTSRDFTADEAIALRLIASKPTDADLRAIDALDQAMQGTDEHTVLDELLEADAALAQTKYGIRIAKSEFMELLGTAAKIEGVCSGSIPKPRLDTTGLRQWAVAHAAESMAPYWTTQAPHFKLARLDGGALGVSDDCEEDEGDE